MRVNRDFPKKIAGETIFRVDKKIPILKKNK